MKIIKENNKKRKIKANITLKQKRDIVIYSEKHPYTSHVDLANIFSGKFKIDITARTVGNYIKNKEGILRNSIKHPKFTQVKRLKYEDIDRNVELFIDEFEKKGCVLTDAIIIEKAKDVALDLKIRDFCASKGWLEKFKKRKNLSSKILSGETFGKDLSDFESFLNTLKEKTKSYKKSEIYNLDETGLFYKNIPSKTICSKLRKGHKNFKERVSILLCSNMDGSDKKTPLLIGKFKKPRCFRKFTTIKKVLYKSSSRAWMNSFLFTEYLRDWNNELLDNKKKICLILDNCPAHNIAENFSQIEMIFLPPNSTGILQPMDLGIIRSFKCKFEALKLKKSFHLSKRIKQYMNHTSQLIWLML